MTETKRHILWIDSLKLIASLFVVMAHYFEGFLYLNMAQSINPTLMTILRRTGGIINGDLWVCMFCLLSGYFSGKKKIASFHDFLTESIIRYLKFILSFFFIGLIIWAMSALGLLLNSQSEAIIGTNTYMSLFYQERINLSTFLSGVFLFSYELNQPTWMMVMILAGNITVYFICWLEQLTKKKTIKAVLFGTAIVVSFAANKLFVGCCILGAVLSMIKEKKESGVRKPAVIIVSVALLTALFLDIPEGLFWKSCELFGHDYITLKHFFMVPLIFIIIKESTMLQSALTIRPLERFSKYSFYIFLVHWSVLSSFTLLIYKVMLKHFSYTATFFTGILLTIPVVMLAAVIYGKTFGTATERILKKIKIVLK